MSSAPQAATPRSRDARAARPQASAVREATGELEREARDRARDSSTLALVPNSSTGWSPAHDAQVRLHDLAHLIGHASVALEANGPTMLQSARESLAACRAMLAPESADSTGAQQGTEFLFELVEREARRALSVQRSGGRIRVLQNVARELRVDGQLGLVERVIRNLLLNAFEASHDGGVVRVRGAREGDSILLEITDEGRGLDRAARTRLYGRDGWTGARGNGLGRASVRACVLRLGGTLVVDGAPGRGLRVTLRWGASARRIGVLVDVRKARARLVSTLAGTGIRVLGAEEALELLRLAPPGEIQRWIVARGYADLAAEDWKRLEVAGCEIRSTLSIAG